jgi:hypothetical protein
MDLDQLIKQRQQLEIDTNRQISEALEDMREDISEANKKAAQMLADKNMEDQTEQGKQEEEEEETPPLQQSQNIVSKPLIYLMYNAKAYESIPSWVPALGNILNSEGYLVYNPHLSIDAQYVQEDVPSLNILTPKINKAFCSVYQIPEETLLSLDDVWKLMQTIDNYSIVFQRLWFLLRSSLIVADLTQPTDSGTATELLYAKQLNIPTIGFLSPTGYLDPFIHRYITAFFSGKDLGSLLPMLKGYIDYSN